MPYKIEFRERAIKEYIEATAWYQERSLSAAENVVLFVEQAIHKIKTQPNDSGNFIKIFTRQKLKTFHLIWFILLMKIKKSVVIITLLYHNRNPKKKFR